MRQIGKGIIAQHAVQGGEIDSQRVPQPGFVAVGVDTSLLANAATELARAFKNTAPVSNDNAKDGSVY